MKSVFATTSLWAEQRHFQIQAYDEIGSTNDEARSEASEIGDDPKLYLAAHQTKGRGRGKNQWLDTGAGEGLLSSWSFQLPKPPQATTGPRIGDALYKAVHAVWPSVDWSLKAPNDLYRGDKKVAGLLVESVSQGSFHRVIIGLGMNVLNHPRAIPTATHFASPGNDVSEAEWYQFLDVLLGQFLKATEDMVLPTLSADVCASLLHALNAHPLKKDAIVKVTPQGDLVTATTKIPWTTQ